MENKKGNVSTVFLVIAIILIVVMGGLLYMQKIESNREIAQLQKEIESISNTINSNNENTSDKTEDNEIKNEDVLGEYVYEVPQQIKDEFGHYYDGITITLLENNKFEYYHAEGFLLKGIYSVDKSNVICNATTEEGEYLEKRKINDKYIFKYENNMLELIKYEGKESEQDNGVFERIGSKYVKNITSLDSKYTEITKKLGNEEIFLLTDTIKNSDGTYTLKGKIITEDTSREPIAEYPFYKETGEYKQITLSYNTKCQYVFEREDDYKTDTVENVFSKKLYAGWGQGPCFDFTFENGKCISVNEIITGH